MILHATTVAMGTKHGWSIRPITLGAEQKAAYEVAWIALEIDLFNGKTVPH